VDGLVRSGMSEAEARAEAERRFGDVGRYRETLLRIDHVTGRRRQRRDWVGDWIRDLRQLLRGLRQAPAFTLGVGITLTLGIGMNATMIGLVDRLLFKPPAHVSEPDRVARYTLTQTYQPFGTFTNTSVTWKEVELMARQATRVEAVAGFASGKASLGRGERARPVAFMTVTPNYFGLLGTAPALGRFFGPADDPIDGGGEAAVISHRMWKRQFGQRPDVIGQELTLGDRVVRVVGVTKQYFNGIDLDATDVWLPFHTGARLLVGASGEWRDTWHWQWVEIVARLADGRTREEASAEATALYRAAVRDDPDRKADAGLVRYEPVIAARGAADSRETMIAGLLAAVSVLLLLLTCANVANLLLARGVARSREIAVRVALGIGRSRLLRVLIGEAVLLGGLGAAGGIALAYGGGTVIRAWFLPNLDFVEPPVDARLLAMTVAIALVTSVLIGLVPAIRMSRPDLTVELKAGGGGQAGGGRRHHRFRRGLLLAQGVLSVLLLLGAGLFVRSFGRVAAVDFGFRPERILVAEVDLNEVGYDKARRQAFYDDAYQRLATRPG
ncbi:MAG: ABC transporter permease, partial [Gemmatimonadales bacterium]|nr:ABC transporter permease [Gemmatimonadales bacterium]